MIENSIATDDMGFDIKMNQLPNEANEDQDSMIEMWKCPKCLIHNDCRVSD